MPERAILQRLTARYRYSWALGLGLAAFGINFGRIEPKDEKHIIEVPLALPSSSLRLIPGESKKVRVSFELQAKRGLWDNMEGGKKRYHTVRSGETLWGISRRYGLTVEEFRSLNNFSPGGTIYPDQRLFVGAANGE